MKGTIRLIKALNQMIKLQMATDNGTPAYNVRLKLAGHLKTTAWTEGTVKCGMREGSGDFVKCDFKSTETGIAGTGV